MNKPACIECGSAPVNHASEWWSNWFEHISNTYFKPLEYIRQKVQRLSSFLPWNAIGITTIRLACFFRIMKIHNELLETDNSRTVALWSSAYHLKIKIERVTLLGHHTEFSIATYKNKSRAYMSLPRPFALATNAFYWMDNKSEMQKRFVKEGLPVPKSFECSSESEALLAFKKINGKAIVKPTYGSRSRHTIVGIDTELAMKKAFAIAKQISPWVMVQEELPGMVHRVLWVGDKVVAVMRREPAYVVGDGKNSIKELVEMENTNPLRHGPIFHQLPTHIDNEATMQLQKQNLSWDNVPPIGLIVVLNSKVSRGNGAVNIDVTDMVHIDNQKLFQKIGYYIGDPLVGIDFIIQDISKSWKDQLPCGVIECNALPYIDLHSHPFSGPMREVASDLWKIVFPEILNQK